MNRKNRWKWGLVTLFFLLVWVLWVWMMTCESVHTWKDWAWLVFFTLLLIGMFWMFAKTVLGDKSAEFTEENLVIMGPFGKKTPIPWSKIEDFGTWSSKYQKQVSVFVRDTEKEIAEMPTATKRFLARANYRFSGAIYFILEGWDGESQEELLERCRKELKNHQTKNKIKHD